MRAIETRVARSVHGDNLFLGHRVSQWCSTPVTDWNLFGEIVGCRLSDEDVAFLNQMRVAIAAADPRIWPLKTARLIASFGDAWAAVGLANYAMSTAAVGHAVLARVTRWFPECVARLASLQSEDERLAECHATLNHPDRLAGFGVPFRKYDERTVALGKIVETHDRAGPHWQAFLLLAEVARQRGLPSPNVALPLAAVLLDVGIPPAALDIAVGVTTLWQYLPNAVEQAQHPDPQLQRYPDSAVVYQGPARRKLQRR